MDNLKFLAILVVALFMASILTHHPGSIGFELTPAEGIRIYLNNDDR